MRYLRFQSRLTYGIIPGGSGLIYSASQDCTIKVWKAETGALLRTLQCHGHWVNVLALNTDYAIRTGAFDPCKQHGEKPTDSGENKRQCEATHRFEDYFIFMVFLAMLYLVLSQMRVDSQIAVSWMIAPLQFARKHLHRFAFQRSFSDSPKSDTCPRKATNLKGWRQDRMTSPWRCGIHWRRSRSTE